MKEYYSKGDRVKSKVYGFYYGLPGTIIDTAQMQYGNFTRFIIELDAGITVTMSADWIEDIDEETE